MATILSFAFQKIYNKTASVAGKRLKILRNLDEEIDFLERHVLPTITESINYVEDAELKKRWVSQPKQRSPMEDWLLQRLKDLASDVEDILDEKSIRDERYPLPEAFASRNLNLSELVCGCCAPPCFGYPNSDRSERRCKLPMVFYLGIANKISNVYEQLKVIKGKKEILSGILPNETLSAQPRHPASSAACVDDDDIIERKHRETSSLMHADFRLAGRDEIKEEILKKLMDPKPEMVVVPITGMGGLGKTTLARSIFNDEGVKGHFKIMKWIFVGKSFDAENLMKQGILDNSKFQGTLEELYKKVNEKVNGIRFLIVLDDVWNEDDQGQWDKLITPLSHGGDGSRILLTTRSGQVAKLSCKNTHDHIKLEPLEYDDCLQLFEKHAFPNGLMDEHRDLKTIGEEIVGRLGGLPLAAKVIGSTLCGETRGCEWEKIRDSSPWGDDTKNVLLWSYIRLPAHLKACFRMCSMFRKGEMLIKKTLVELWIANGYVRGSSGEQPLELGHGYINDLRTASLLEDVDGDRDKFYRYDDDYYTEGDDDYTRFKMHDVIHDLAEMVSRGEICKVLSIDSEHTELFLGGEIFKIEQGSKQFSDRTEKIRHLAIYGNDWNWNPSVHIDSFFDWKRIRTLISTEKTPSECIYSQLFSIRYLDTESIGETKKLIKKLIHLRCLSHRYGCNMFLLQHVSELTKLRVLEQPKYGPYPVKAIGKLKSLQYLGAYGVSSEAGYGIKELNSLSELRGQLCIRGLEEIKGGTKEAEELGMIYEKKFVKKLELYWNESVRDEATTIRHGEVIEGLRPPINLRELEISGFCGMHLEPSWMRDDWLTGIVSIKLDRCTNLAELPPLGQLHGLKYLRLKGLSKLQKVSRQFYGRYAAAVFPSLEVLKFDDIPEWQEWEGLDDKGSLEFFPSLRELEIRRCRKLRAIPHLPFSVKDVRMSYVGLTLLPRFWGCHHADEHRQLSFLTTLWIRDCPLLESLGECLLQHPSSVERMEVIRISDCDALIKVSAGRDITSSEKTVLWVDGCRKLKTLELPGLIPTYSLSISGCGILEDISLGSLASLKSLTFYGSGDASDSTVRKMLGMGASTSANSMLHYYSLPKVTSLNTDSWDLLKAVDPTKLKTLSLSLDNTELGMSKTEKQWWQSLVALRWLTLSRADGLLRDSLFWNPLGRLPSLETLRLWGCPETRSLPERELSRSLRELHITDCPHLAERYKDGGAGRGILLDHVPQLRISTSAYCFGETR